MRLRPRRTVQVASSPAHSIAPRAAYSFACATLIRMHGPEQPSIPNCLVSADVGDKVSPVKTSKFRLPLDQTSKTQRMTSVVNAVQQASQADNPWKRAKAKVMLAGIGIEGGPGWKSDGWGSWEMDMGD